MDKTSDSSLCTYKNLGPQNEVCKVIFYSKGYGAVVGDGEHT